jgi:hypothetical protein
MRQNYQIKYSKWITYSILILFVFYTLLSLNAVAEDEKLLFIVIHDSETNLPIEEDIFLEGKKYDIAIGNVGEYGYEYNVTVSVSGMNSFLTSEELPWITIETPPFKDYPEILITAMKDGYVSTEQKITVLKGELYLMTDRGTVQEKKSFSVIVSDQNNNKIENATVYLDGDGLQPDSDVTGSNGIAYLTAHDVPRDDVIKINVFKEGYYPGSTTIRVENDAGGIPIGGLTPIIVAFIVLIISMVFVRVKNEIPILTNDLKSNSLKKKIKNNGKNVTKKMSEIREEVTTKDKNKVQKKDRGPWVEEIHISKPRKGKHSKYVLEDTKKITFRHKK